MSETHDFKNETLEQCDRMVRIIENIVDYSRQPAKVNPFDSLEVTRARSDERRLIMADILEIIHSSLIEHKD